MSVFSHKRQILDLLGNVKGYGYGDKAQTALCNYLEDPKHTGEQIHNVYMAEAMNGFDGSAVRLEPEKHSSLVYSKAVYFAAGLPVDFPTHLPPLQGVIKLLGDLRREHDRARIEDSKRHNKLIGYERGEQAQITELKARILRLEGQLEEARRR